jgi:hypothetical protein
MFENKLYFHVENGEVVQISTGGFDYTSLPKGRGFANFAFSIATVGANVLFFLVLPIVILVGKIRGKNVHKNNFYRFSNLFMLCGTAIMINNVILVLRPIINILSLSVSGMSPHIWLNYILLIASVVAFALSLILIKGNEIKTRRKVAFGASGALMLLMFIVLFDWSFFVLLK